jgi:hypothetical protein
VVVVVQMFGGGVGWVRRCVRVDSCSSSFDKPKTPKRAGSVNLACSSSSAIFSKRRRSMGESAKRLSPRRNTRRDYTPPRSLTPFSYASPNAHVHWCKYIASSLAWPSQALYRLRMHLGRAWQRCTLRPRIYTTTLRPARQMSPFRRRETRTGALTGRRFARHLNPRLALLSPDKGWPCHYTCARNTCPRAK